MLTTVLSLEPAVSKVSSRVYKYVKYLYLKTKRISYEKLDKSGVQKIEADYNRSADTHLLKIDIPKTPSIHLYLKDESTHSTGSLKHRLARSLFLYALCNGRVK
jgi:hypothetical protein